MRTVYGAAATLSTIKARPGGWCICHCHFRRQPSAFSVPPPSPCLPKCRRLACGVQQPATSTGGRSIKWHWIAHAHANASRLTPGTCAAGAMARIPMATAAIRGQGAFGCGGPLGASPSCACSELHASLSYACNVFINLDPVLSLMLLVQNVIPQNCFAFEERVALPVA